MLPTRQLIPPLTIHASDGRTVSAWDFKQKSNLVIAFLDADCISCEEFLRRLAAHAMHLRGKEAVALVVFLEPPPSVLSNLFSAEIIAGSDVPGCCARAFLGRDALSSSGFDGRAVFVTDRYGELFAQWVISGHDFPGIGEILSSLEQIEFACEECSVPLWTPDASGGFPRNR